MNDTEKYFSTKAIIEVQAASTDGKKLPTFSMVAYSGGAKNLGWRYPVVTDLKGMSIQKQSMPMRMQHDAMCGVGHTTSISVQNNQLVASGVFSRDTQYAKEITASAANGYPWEASIGASVQKLETIKEGEKVSVNGQTFDGPIYVVRASTLGEISFVDSGADPNTSVSIAAKKGNSMPTNVVNVDPVVTPNADPVVQAAAVQVATGAVDPIMTMRQQHSDELARIASITAMAGAHPDINAKAVGEGWSIDKTKIACQEKELADLRAARPGAPAAHIKGGEAVTKDILAAACMQSGGFPELEKQFKPEILEASDKMFKGRMGLNKLMYIVAQQNGYRGYADDHLEIQRHAFSQGIQASGIGFSTADVSGILSNVANKFLLNAFYQVEQSFREISSSRPVNDFKQATSYRLTGADQFQIVGPSGDLKSGTMGNEKYTNQAATTGLMINIPREFIINDDLGALTEIPKKMGRGAALKLNDIFWTAWAAMTTNNFFSSGNNNLLTGATTAFGLDSMGLIVPQFMLLNDAQGNPLNLQMTKVLVPPALKPKADYVFKSDSLRDGGATAKYGTTNIYQGQYPVVSSAYLQNAKYGNSAIAWYGIGDPSVASPIEIAYLKGQETPTIETVVAAPDVLGITMRGYFDFGVNQQDLRGAIKMAGA